MLIYLDNCCFNRPFDNQKQIQILIETEAKLFIQEQIANGILQLAWSYILDYENSVNPFPEKRETIQRWKKRAVADTSETENILLLAEKLFLKGVKSKDALHVACAVELRCLYFITTDRNLLKKLSNFECIKVVSPVDFIHQMEIK